MTERPRPDACLLMLSTGASHPTTTGKRTTTLPRGIAAVVLTVLALSNSVPDEWAAPEQSKAAGSLGRAWDRGPGLGSRVDMGKTAETRMAIGLPESIWSASSLRLASAVR